MNESRDKEKERLEQENTELKRILGIFTSQLEDEFLEKVREARCERRQI